MAIYPLDHLCTHIATPEEALRDARYMFCNAVSGTPCRWAKRFDGYPNPAFHSERLQAAQPSPQYELPAQKKALEEAILETGLV